MARKNNAQTIGELIGAVQAVDRRVTDIKTDMTEGLKDIKTKLTKMNEGLEVKDQAYGRRFGRLEAWRNRFLGGMGILTALIPVIVVIIVFVMNKYR
jgi:hypothetical protein